MISAAARRAQSFFTKELAGAYEEKAKRRSLWPIEEAMLGEILTGTAHGSTVLDIPVGTGRFLPLYSRLKLVATGIDASEEMLALAAKKSGAKKATLTHGDVFAIDAGNRSFDIVVSIRLMHLIDHDDFRLAMRELQRVADKRIIVSMRFGDEVSRFRGPERRAVLRECLQGWSLTSEALIHGDWYLVVLDR